MQEESSSSCNFLETSELNILLPNTIKNETQKEVKYDKNTSVQEQIEPTNIFTGRSSKKEFTSVQQSFKFFFNEELLNFSLKQMNKKIIRYNDSRSTQTPSIIDHLEIKKFVGILMLFSLTNPKNISFVWKKTSLCYSHIVANAMPYNRFWALYSKFSFFSKKDKLENKIIKNPKIVNT